MAIYTGMRQGEILGLRWQDVDLAAGVARVQQTLQVLPGGFAFGEPKSSKGRRQIVLPREVVEMLKVLRHDQAEHRLCLDSQYRDNDLIFCREDGAPIDTRNLTHRFKNLARHAGFPKLRFHDLRHTHATLLLAEGVHPKIVQERLGHETISITLDTYSHVLPGLQEEAVRRLEKRIGHRMGTDESK